MVPTFLCVAWLGEDFHERGVQDVAEFYAGLCPFPLDGERRREDKKKER
jgi:hypothetical protein